jgi:hypothetical protein
MSEKEPKERAEHNKKDSGRMHSAFTEHMSKLSPKHSAHHVAKSHPMHPEHKKDGCK